jgi:hypothetical protein
LDGRFVENNLFGGCIRGQNFWSNDLLLESLQYLVSLDPLQLQNHHVRQLSNLIVLS